MGEAAYVMDMDMFTDDGGSGMRARVELDSHADTCCSGWNTVLLEESGRKVDVNSFTPEHESLNDIPIGTSCGAYDCDKTGETYLLIWHESLYFGDRLPMTLVNPNQVRDSGTLWTTAPGSSSHIPRTAC